MSASRLPTARRTRTTAGAGPPPAAGGPASRRDQRPLALGRYRLHRRLGTGGFGTVWEARDERLERDVAVKILPRERIVGGRFEREARAAARLSHPAIVTLYEAAVDEDGAYLVSELVRGATLDQLLTAGRLSDRDILAVGIALCDALVHAHAQGIIHRDVKPSNVLVPDRPTSAAQIAKLTDFGVARVIGGDSLTRTGDVIGTAAYMAPEQAEGREAAAPADLYALAVVLYEALTGINPIPASTAAQRARRLGAHLPPLRRQRRDLPRELGAGIDLALRPRPRERGSLEDLRRSLVASVPQVGEEPGVVAAPWRSPTPSRRTQTDGEGELEAFAEPPAVQRRPGLDNAADDRAIDGEERVAGTAPAPSRAKRGLAAAVVALLVAWVSIHLHSSSTVPPALAAFVTGALVLVLPRAGWLLSVLAIAGLAIASGRPGGALVVTIVMLVPLALLPSSATDWPLGAGGPALGLVGLAGAWPALAARARGAWRRAALGAIGWVWTLLAAPLAGADLYLRRPPGTPSPAVWTASVHQAAAHVLGPLATSGALAVTPVWALAAVTLPWLIRARSLAVRTAAAIIWAAASLSLTAAVLAAVHVPNSGLAGPQLIGALAGVAIALAPRAAAEWVLARESQPGLS